MTPAERVDTALACLAVDRRLGGLLLVGLPPAVLPLLGQRLNAMLSDGHDAAEVVNLGAIHDDDHLWWVPQPVGPDGAFRFGMVAGPLIDVQDGPPRTVIIPDLAQASLAVIRAAVSIPGADAAVADRHGRHESWQPRSRWLAACARPDLGRLSPHLLDRFAVRVDAAELWSHGRARDAIRAALAADGLDEAALLDFPPLPASGQWRARRRFPGMTEEAIALVVATIGTVAAATRRDLALARMARAIAMLDASAAVSADHVRRAAAVLGLKPVTPGEVAPPQPPTPPAPASPGEVPETTAAAPAARESAAAEPVPDHLPADGQASLGGNEPTAPALLGDTAISPDHLQGGMYPEDDPASIAEYASLREPWQRSGRPRAARGHVVGTEPTPSLSEIAVVPTAFEAAKFQPFRRGQNGHARSGLIIYGSDLRRYRYQPRPDTAVVLVLDHSCRRYWDSAAFRAAVEPYLQWAYVRHAVLTMVELGYRNAPDEFRATAYRTTSVLNGLILASLGRTPGGATPLAHALDISVQEMRRHLRQVEVMAENSWLIVVSDGRGNVPLEASHRGRQPGFVSREGVTDAMRAARTARSLPLPRAHKVVLAPARLTHYAHLPFDLAAEMDGIVAESSR